MHRVLALGFFDGVHLGHGALLNKTKERAASLGAVPSVLSFDVHPDRVVFGQEVPLIGDTSSREEIIRRCYGIENVVFIHFSKSVSQMPWQEFAERLIDELDAVWLVCGHDFSFGYKGEGTAEKLKEYCRQKGIGCDIIPAVVIDGQTVSSTHIRELLKAGDIEEANRLLGHPHCLSDTVHSGYHLGQKIDAPTINMFFPPSVIVPRLGVYATKVVLADGGEYRAVTNIGVRPTVSDDNTVSVESHLLHYEGNLYGVPARVDFYKFLRPEQKFEDLESLSRQIKNDAEETEKYFQTAEKA